MLPLLVSAGYLNIDVVAAVPCLPSADQRVTSDRIWRLLGGMAANAACGAAALGGPLAAQVELLTFVGDDDESAWALSEVGARGVATSWCMRRLGGCTPKCVILVEPNGQRVIVSEPIDFDDALIARRMAQPELPDRPRLLHVDGYRVPTVFAALSAARTAGWRTSVDLDGLSPSWRDEEGLRRMAQSFDVIFANRNAINAIWPRLLEGSGGVAAVAYLLRRILREHAAPGASIVVTLGGEGSLVVERDAAPLRVAALPITPLDTTGAGDIFAGTFLVALLHGRTPAAAAQIAAVAGGLSTLGFGAQGRLPSADEILAEASPLISPVT